MKLKKSKRKKNKQLEAILQLYILGMAAFGWFVTKELSGIFTFVIVGFILMIAVMTWLAIRKRAKLKRSGIVQIDSMDGVQFEHYLRELFKSRGYKVKLTAETGDFGADLLLIKENERIVVQAKRYSKPVGIKAVQEVIPAMKMYDAEFAWVITNNTFTKAAVELAEKHEVKLIDRDKLINYINDLNPNLNPNPVEIKKSVQQHTRKKCEACGSEMVIRQGKNGIFYGCKSFPECKHTAKAI